MDSLLLTLKLNHMRPRINRTTGQPLRTHREVYLMKKELGITPKQSKYNNLCRQMSTIN